MPTVTERTDNDGAATYQAKVRLKGYPQQSATFARLTDATKWATQTEAAIREGRHFKTTEAKRHTLADQVDRYTREVLPGKKDGDHQARQLDCSCPAPPWSCCANAPRSGGWTLTWYSLAGGTRPSPQTCEAPSVLPWLRRRSPTSTGTI